MLGKSVDLNGGGSAPALLGVVEADESWQSLSHLFFSCGLLLWAWYLYLQPSDGIITAVQLTEWGFQDGKVLCLSPSGDGGPMLLWLHVLPFCQYLVLTPLICWNIALLRKSKHLLFPRFNIGLWERMAVITASYQAPKMCLSCAFEFAPLQCHFLNANLIFCLDCWK